MLDVFSLAAKLTLDSSDYENGLKNAKEKGGGLGSALKTAMGVGVAAIGAAGTAMAAFGKSAVDAGLNFDATMSEVAAISGATGKDFDALREKAQEMGATTKFSASESAEALTYMAMAGWKTEDMLGGIEGIMNLAAASGENLATTSDIVTDALTAFGLSAQDSGHFADILAAASSNANTNVSMLGESFKYVAPVAGAMGMSAEDVSVALGLMANAGIKASQGGTALRTVLGNMAKPTDDMVFAMETLGVSLTDEEGKMNSLMDIMEQMRRGFKGATISQEEYAEQTAKVFAAHEEGKMNDEAFAKELRKLKLQYEGLSEAEGAELASMLAGKEGMSGLLAIVNASDEDFAKLTESIYSADGAAEEMSRIMQDNLQGDITIMQSALEGLKIAVSDELTPSLREFVQFGSEGLSRLTTAFKEGGLDGAMEEFGKILSDGIAMIVDKLPEITKAGAKLLGALIKGLIDNLPQMVDAALEIVETLADDLARSLPELIPAIVDIIITIVDNLTDPQTLSELIDASIAIMMALANGLIDAVPRLLEKVPEILDNLVTTFADNAPKLLESAKELIQKLVDGLKDTQNLKKIVNSAIKLITTLAFGLIDAIPVLLESLPEIITALVTTLVELAPQLVTAAAEIIAKLVLGIVENLDKIGEVAGTLIGAFIETVTQSFVQLWELGSQIVGGVWQGIQDKAAEFKEKVQGFFEGIVGGVKKVLGISSPSKVFRDQIGKNMALGVAEGIADNVGYIVKQAEDAAMSVTDAFGSAKMDMSGDFSANAGLQLNQQAYMQERPMTVEMKFDGNLAQLARILRPEILVEGKRVGNAIVVGV